MVKLPDPQLCPRCKRKGVVVESRMVNRLGKGKHAKVGAGACYRRRRRRCAVCKLRWTSFETTINPMRLKLKTSATPA